MIETVVLDVDGVLANFVHAALQENLVSEDDIARILHNWPKNTRSITKVLSRYFDRKVEPQEFWDALDHSSFWPSLMPYRKGTDLYMRLLETGLDIVICTSPSRSFHCADGKRRWLSRYCPELYQRGAYLIGSQKWRLAHSKTLLIDDSEENCTTFEQAGGWSVVWPQPWNRNRGKDGFELLTPYLHGLTVVKKSPQ
jgi:hypothetical protein